METLIRDFEKLALRIDSVCWPDSNYDLGYAIDGTRFAILDIRSTEIGVRLSGKLEGKI